MKKQTPLADRETRVNLVNRIYAEFPKPGQPGKADWKSAFSTHPDWRTALGAIGPVGEGRNYAFASSIRKNAEGAATAPTTPNPAPPPPSAPPVLATPDGQQRAAKVELLKSVAARYPWKNGKVKWKAAWASEPQLRENFGKITDIGWFYKRYVLGQKKHAASRKTKQSRVGVSAQAPVVSPSIVSTLRCCPHCGFLLEYLQKAYDATTKMQPSV